MALTFIFVLFAAALATAQDSQSADKVKALVERLTARHLDSAAAVDPAHPNRILAALYLPPSQLMVVGATRTDSNVLAANIHDAKYRDVYMDLQSAPAVKDKVFIHDIGADGLLRDGKDVADNVYEDGTRLELAKGKKAADRFGELDAEYARMLDVLIAALDHAAAPAPAATTAQQGR
jgi:hypothetical protein